MEIFIYLLIFIMGTFFGSFFTLAVYRIPLKQDIVHTHSYCPNCKHKLGILDLFPVFSYIFLKGKCRYCGEKIRIRYLLLEILTGLVFLIYAVTYKFDILNINYFNVINFAFGILYFVTLFISIGIDKEKIKIENSILIYSFIISIGYILYVCTQLKASVYSYAIYLFIMLIGLIVNMFLKYKNNKENYYISLIVLCAYMGVFSGIIGLAMTLLLTSIIIFIVYIIKKISKKEFNQIPICFYLSISNIALILLIRILNLM